MACWSEVALCAFCASLAVDHCSCPVDCEACTVRVQVLLRWALQQGCAVIPKSLNKEHIAELSPSKLLSWELSDKHMEMLNGMEDGHKYCWDAKDVL